MKKVMRLVLAGAALGFAGGQMPAMAQQIAMVSTITAPNAGASVNSPVTVSYQSDRGSDAAGGTGHHRALHAFLVIDAATPAAGTEIAADADHVAFPAGQFDIRVALAHGAHRLQVVFINRKGEVSKRFQPSPSVSFSVR